MFSEQLEGTCIMGLALTTCGILAGINAKKFSERQMNRIAGQHSHLDLSQPVQAASSTAPTDQEQLVEKGALRSHELVVSNGGGAHAGGGQQQPAAAHPVPAPSEWRVGMAAVCFTGIWGGSIMVPTHGMSRAPADYASYSLAFGSTALLVIAVLWCINWRSVPLYVAQCRVVWRRGLASGCLWAVGNVCSAVAVNGWGDMAGLGLALGYSAVQCNLVVSSTWGVCLFREVQGAMSIGIWAVGAVLVLAGIIMIASSHR